MLTYLVASNTPLTSAILFLSASVSCCLKHTSHFCHPFTTLFPGCLHTLLPQTRVSFLPLICVCVGSIVRPYLVASNTYLVAPNTPLISVTLIRHWFLSAYIPCCPKHTSHLCHPYMYVLIPRCLHNLLPHTHLSFLPPTYVCTGSTVLTYIVASNTYLVAPNTPLISATLVRHWFLSAYIPCCPKHTSHFCHSSTYTLAPQC